MSSDNNDFVYQAVARAKQVAAKLAAGGGAGDLGLGNNGSADSYGAASLKRGASDSLGGGPGPEKRALVGSSAAAAAEAAARINEKLGVQGGGNPLASQTLTVYHKIPDKFVGLVIGKKGEQIIQLQQDACCKVQISQEGGQAERDITMIGTPSQIEKAKQMMNDIIERAGGSISGSGNVHSIDVMIPGLKAGLIIGKNGETIKHLQENTGAKMVLIQDSNAPSQDDKPLRITGDPQSVEKAKDMVIQLLSNKDGGTYPKQPFPTPPENADLCVYAVPTEKAGLVIGKGGETIREICTRSGAFVEISKQQTADPASKLFNVRGQRHEIESALRFISERAGIPVGAPHSYYPGGHENQSVPNYGNNQQWAAGYGNPAVAATQQGWSSGQQPAAAMPPPTINPQTGQPDYSAAWAEYYRRQGMNDYADMILRQAAQQNPNTAQQYPGAGQAAQQQGAYPSAPQQAQAAVAPDYSQQWQQWQQYQQSAGAQGAQPWMGQPVAQATPTQPQQPQPQAHQHAAWANAAQSGYGNHGTGR